MAVRQGIRPGLWRACELYPAGLRVLVLCRLLLTEREDKTTKPTELAAVAACRKREVEACVVRGFSQALLRLGHIVSRWKGIFRPADSVHLRFS